MEPISVLIVDDSALMRNLIRRMLESDSDISVAGTALNGEFALRKTLFLKPDVIILDLEMPVLDGFGFLEKRKENNWDIPVVILSAVAKKGAEVTMRALALGASDFITKPAGNSPEDNRRTAEQLIEMVKGYGGAYRKKKAFLNGEKAVHGSSPAKKTYTAPASGLPSASHKEKKKVSGDVPSALQTRPSTAPASPRDNWPVITPRRQPAPPEIIAIGISTGGPNALRTIFPKISPSLKLPIVVVQHMPAGFTLEFAKSLDRICPLEVKEAADGDLVKPGRILIAPGDKHVVVEKRKLATVIKTLDTENVNGHKPSAGVLFDSVAKEFGNAAVAIIMTGMGRDGSREIGTVYEEGGITIAQDEETSVVFGMPRVAIEHNYITRVEPLEKIAEVINELGT